MKRGMWLMGALVALLWASPAKADTGIIIRTTAGLPALQLLCALPTTCTVDTVVGALDGKLGQVFLVTTPLPLQTFLGLLPGGLTGFVDAEVDQVLNLVGGLNAVTTAPGGLTDTTPVNYFGTMVWNGYANQPAAGIVHVSQAQTQFGVGGRGIVADIDTGVDPNHPALQGVLLPGYDFTRNQAGASELNDLTQSDFPVYPPPPCGSTNCPAPATVNHGHFACNLLCRAKQRQRHQHEFRFQDGLDGAAERPRLREPAQRDLRGLGGERRPGPAPASLSRGTAKRCDGCGIHERHRHALLVLKLRKRHRVGGGSGRSHRHDLPVQHVFSGLGDVVQRAVRFRRGCAAAERANRHQ